MTSIRCLALRALAVAYAALFQPRLKAVTSGPWQGSGKKRKAAGKNAFQFRIRIGEVCSGRPRGRTNHPPLATRHWLLASPLRIRNGEVCSGRPRGRTSHFSFANVLRLATVLSIATCHLALITVLTPLATAQSSDATITGIVTDPSKAVIRAAKVDLINANTGVHYSAITNGSGIYTVSGQVGNYRIEVEHVGFKTVIAPGIVLHTQDVLEINFEMAVGSTSESVTVNATASNDNPAISLTVTREFIENMPLNGRSFQDLIQLAPGTVSNGSGYYSINGQRTDANNYTVDGVSANLGGYNNTSVTSSQGSGLSGSSPSQTVLGTTQSLASIDSLQEFTIQTSGYAAEYGRTPGGQVQFTTRSGGNDIHGSIFEYIRNTAFDANSYENNYFSHPRTAEHQNDFGGTLGGPLIVPKLYKGTDKTFYFLSYEGLRLLLPAFESEYVPTATFRQWASPYVQPYLNSKPLPSPSSPGNSDNCTIPDPATSHPTACDALFTYGYSNPYSLDNVSVRLDQNLGARFHAFARYSDTPSSTVGGAESIYTKTINVHTWTSGLTATLAPDLLNDFRFNYSRDGEEAAYSQKAIGGSIPTPRSLFIPAAYDGPYAAGYFNLSVSGTSLSISSEYAGTGTVQHQYQLVDSLTWAKGAHSLKFGGDWRRLTPSYASQTYESQVVISTLANIQQGYATDFYTSATAAGKPVFDNLSIYAQDHWTISPRLSIDYGLRWEFNPPPGPSNGYYPVTLTSSDLATATLTNDGNQPYETNYHSFAPRFGFSWNAAPSHSHALTVRGGFGIFFDTGQTLIGNSYAKAYPFSVTGPTQQQVPLPLSSMTLAPPSLNVPLTTPYPYISNVSDPTLTSPYTEQWNLSIDEELNAKNTLTASYVGNNGRKLLFTQQYSGINPAFTYFAVNSNGAQSSYNALQIQDTGRITTSVDLAASFTLAHALDNESTDTATSAPIWGNSNLDLRRVLNVALNYQTPTASHKRWVRVLADRWLFANRFSAQSGYPFNIQQASGYLPSGQSVLYQPDLVAGVPIYLHGRQADLNGKAVPGSWRLNPDAFKCVPTNETTPCLGTPIRLGTLGRNYVRNPSFWALNTALQRNFSIYETLRLNFRIEAFNIFNHPNLSDADNYLTDSTFGQLSVYNLSTIGSNNALYAMGAARSLQFSLQLQF